MSSTVVYNGFLSERTCEYIKCARRDYDYVIEMKELPPNWADWSRNNLVDYDISSEDCQGNLIFVKTKQYSYFYKDNDRNDTMFLFLKSLLEKIRVVEAFPELIVNREPFKTAIC